MDGFDLMTIVLSGSMPFLAFSLVAAILPRVFNPTNMRMNYVFSIIHMVATGVVTVVLYLILLHVRYARTNMPMHFFSFMLVCCSAGVLYNTNLFRRDWFCDECGNRVSERVGWICGYCDHENKRLSVVQHCERCREVPRAFICYHCQVVIPLEERDIEEQFAARRVGTERKRVAAKETDDEKRRSEKQARQHEIDMLKLEADLEREKAHRDLVGKKKSPSSSIEEKFAQESGAFIAVYQLSMRGLAQAEETFKNDPKMLEDYKAWLEDFKTKHKP